MKILLHKQEDYYLPYDEEAVCYTRKVKENTVLSCEIKRARNPLYHRRAFKMMRIMFDMIDSELEFTPWRHSLTILAGYYKSIGETRPDGSERVYVYPDSLSFENFDEDEFHDWFKAFHAAFCRRYGDKLTLNQLGEWASM